MPRVTRETEQERHEQQLMSCSVERMINTTISILERIQPMVRGRLEDDVSINLQDWLELRSHVTRVWDEARNQALVRAAQS